MRAAIVAENVTLGNITFDLDVVTPITASLNGEVDASEDQPQQWQGIDLDTDIGVGNQTDFVQDVGNLCSQLGQLMHGLCSILYSGKGFVGMDLGEGSSIGMGKDMGPIVETDFVQDVDNSKDMRIDTNTGVAVDVNNEICDLGHGGSTLRASWTK